MASLAPTVKDKGFQNWLRGALAVLFAKQGLDAFVGSEITQFQNDLLALIFANKLLPAGTVCNACTTENVLSCPTPNFCSRRGRCNVHDTGKLETTPNQPCPINICQDIRDGIRRQHRFNGPSWKNSIATKWCTDAFEIAKCFMPPDGYSAVTSLADTDFNGTLAVIINNRHFQNKMTAQISLQSNICTEARETARLIRHSPDLTLSDTELASSIDTLIDLLSDQTCLAADPKAQEAVTKLKQLKSNTLTIITADITTVLDSKLKDIISRQRDEAQEKIEEKTKASLKLLEDVKDSLANIGAITTTSLDQIVCLKTSAIEGIKLITEKGKKELKEIVDTGNACKRARLDEEAERNRLENSLKQDLITFYRHNYSTIPIAPLVEDDDEPLVDFYVQPPLTSIEVQKRMTQFKRHKEKLPVYSYHDLFYRSDGGLYKNIYITAKAGIGKTSFAKKLCLTWCQAHDFHENIAEKFKCEDVEIMKQFHFLFLIYLRDTDSSLCQLDSMIYSQVINSLAGRHRYSDHFFRDTLQDRTCLIVLDGLDEWAHPECCKRGNVDVHEIPHRPVWERCTIITTTRPWKLDAAKLSTNQRDRHVEINELNEDSSDQLVSNAVNLLNKRREPDSQKLAKEFQSTLSPLKLDTIRYIPYVLLQIICLWFDEKSVGKSKCQVYSNILELTLSRGLIKLGKNYQPPAGKLQLATQGVPLFCFFSNEFCKKHNGILLDLGKLAFETLFTIKGQAALLFDRDTVLRFISEDELDFFLKIGLLSQNKDDQHVSRRRSILSFQHKSVQEYFAALYINSDPLNEDIKQKLCHVCNTFPAIIDMSNVFVFLGGLNHKVCGEILHLLSNNDTENLIYSYRKYVFVDIHPTIYYEIVRSFQSLQTDIVQEIIDNDQSDFPLYTEDIILEYDRKELYSLIKPLVRRNLSNIKSLHIKERRSEEDLTKLMETLDLQNVKSLHKLEIDGVPRQQDLQSILSASVHTLSRLCLAFVVIKDNMFQTIDTRMLPQNVSLMLHMGQLLSLNLNGVCMTHSCMEALLKHLSNRTNMTEMVLDSIKCTDHDECSGPELDLSQHQKLTLLALRRILISNLRVQASSLEICNIGPLSGDVYSSFIKSLEDAKCLNTFSIQNSFDLLDKTVKMLPKLANLRNFFIMFIDLGDSLFTLPREMTKIEQMFYYSVKMTSTSFRSYIASVDALAQPVMTLMDGCTVTPEEEYQEMKRAMKSSQKYRILFDGLNSLRQSVFKFQTVGISSPYFQRDERCIYLRENRI